MRLQRRQQAQRDQAHRRTGRPGVGCQGLEVRAQERADELSAVEPQCAGVDEVPGGVARADHVRRVDQRQPPLIERGMEGQHVGVGAGWQAAGLGLRRLGRRWWRRWDGGRWRGGEGGGGTWPLRADRLHRPAGASRLGRRCRRGPGAETRGSRWRFARRRRPTGDQQQGRAGKQQDRAPESAHGRDPTTAPWAGRRRSVVTPPAFGRALAGAPVSYRRAPRCASSAPCR